MQISPDPVTLHQIGRAREFLNNNNVFGSKLKIFKGFCKDVDNFAKNRNGDGIINTDVYYDLWKGEIMGTVNLGKKKRQEPA